MIAFAFPLRHLHWWLGLAVLLMVAFVFLLRWLEQRRAARLQAFADSDLAARLFVGYDPQAARKPLFWLPLLGFGFLLLTFAQPHFGQSWQEIRKTSHDVIICIDTSESMRAPNPLPSRMERAKQKIQSLLDRASGDRFGMVAFSGGAELHCPLTLDHGYFRAVLGSIDTDTISAEGTDIAAAIKEAVKAFQDESERTQVYDRDSRAILLISDGEQVAGDAVKEAEKAAEYAHVYVIGVGDPSGVEITLPEWMERYVPTRGDKKTHLSKLDEDTLSKVALMGKGGYIRSTPDNSDINDIYDYIAKLSARSVSGDVRQRFVNRFQWPLAAAIVCFAGEGVWLVLLPWLRRRRARRAAIARGVVAILLLGLLSGMVPGSAWAQEGQAQDQMQVQAQPQEQAKTFAGRLREANKALKSGAAEDALGIYHQLRTEEPESPLLDYNEGCANYLLGMTDAAESAPIPPQMPAGAPGANAPVQGGQTVGTGGAEASLESLEKAENAFKKTLTAPDQEIRKNGHFNLANTMAQMTLNAIGTSQNEYAQEHGAEAVKLYKDYAKAYPDDPRGEQNLSYFQLQLKKKLQQMERQKQQPQQGQGQQDQKGQEQQQQQGQKGEQDKKDGEKKDGEKEEQEQKAQAEQKQQQGNEGEQQDQKQQGKENEGEQQDQQNVEAILQNLEDTDKREHKADINQRQNIEMRGDWW
jgi:Ca-activated chloride channel family protein